MDVETRPITATEVVAFFGSRPPFTIRGMAFYIGGNLVGIGGVRNENGVWLAFSDIRKDVKVPAITIWRHAKRVVKEIVSEMQAPVYAVVDKQNKLGRKWANGLGFKLCSESDEVEVYRWI